MDSGMTNRQTTPSAHFDKPKIWPWVVLAIAIVVALLWASSYNTAGNNMYRGGTSQYGTSPGLGTGHGAGDGMPVPVAPVPAPFH